ncbi:prolyl-tRNA synthetase [Nonlabens ulvanivorans]|nr:prolyl-tRNA synthetase [Nonlabens ulvanivorans]
MGALIMTHSDDKGLVLPPNLAPNQIVIVPIFKTDEQFEEITNVVNHLMKSLRSKGVTVKYDKRDTLRPGAKFAQHELQGVPLRIAIGTRDLENGTVELARRDTLSKETTTIDGIEDKVVALLEEIQSSLYNRALDYKNTHTTKVDTFDEFKDVLENKGGFISAHWDGAIETEDKIKEITKATIRCIPLDSVNEDGKCVFSGNKSSKRVLFAKAY